MRPHGYAGAAWLHSSAVPQPSALPDAVLDVSGNKVSGRGEEAIYKLRMWTRQCH